ncbi:hypothetical protein K432DRAFT_386900 [Lepidopterella palustris CBS 459.81]|uniref:Dihydrofolate reductase n=1 Tax=Lepidopterella palustris CBS 459.81 TaxID=1314670 RepID=A0A8E2DZ72_9PEZI|nr:hypothetical protein K432DRAFT_386900 [Lepidopterella palustris CBS 459.81]
MTHPNVPASETPQPDPYLTPDCVFLPPLPLPQTEPQPQPSTTNPDPYATPSCVFLPPEMPPAASKSSLPLTLILAATPSLGIGWKGGLPWKGIKADMAFFARVTRRVSEEGGPVGTVVGETKNAVIMGRRTWESIPERFRPLKERVNVVVSRQGAEALGAKFGGGEGKDEVLFAASVQEALGLLENRRRDSGSATRSQIPHTERPYISRVFVIGGASIYEAALALPQTRRILLTKIGTEYDCDTVFPLDLEGEEGRKQGWVRRSKEQLEAFVGEELGEGGGVEGGVSYEFCLFEKVVE